MRRLIQRRKRLTVLTCMLAVATLIVTIAGWKWFEPTAQAATFSVTNTNNSGAGSLRDAIDLANGAAGADVISFNIPASDPNCNATTHVCTITPVTGLSAISSPVVLDGYTQPGSMANTVANGDDAKVLIEISGATIGNNGSGLQIDSGGGGSTIRGLVIDNGWSDGILIRTTNIVIQGCFLGTDPAGLVAHGNSNGINFSSSFDTSSCQIGGTSPSQRNIISGNDTGLKISVFAAPSSNEMVQGNFIGTDATGTAALANNTTAIDVQSNDTLIGGTTAAARNIIAGNGTTSTGISVGRAARLLIQGNFIGTDVTGTKALGFSSAIDLSIGSPTQIGGFTATPGTPPGNVISGSRTGINDSGNGSVGVSNSTIQGNLIGTDANGTSGLGNSLDGIHLTSASNVVGGTDVMARNVISGNGRGVFLGGGNSVHDNRIQGNFIGTDISGTQLLGNGNDGVFVVDSINNTIGGIATPGTFPGNLISGNGGNGVGVGTGSAVTGLAIEGNSIFSNGALGIDLNRDGVTGNDSCDSDSGPNSLQNFPVINSAVSSGGSTTITGTLNSTASTSFTIDFYSNPSCDASGNGEGRTYLGSTMVTTDASCNANINAMLMGVTLATGAVVTATATDPSGNTSEFSACTTTFVVSPGQLQFSAATYSVNENGGSVTITVTRTNGSDGAVSVQFATSNGTATAGSDYTATSGTLNFADGDTSNTFTVPILDDAVDEPDETVNLTLSNPTGGATLGTQSTATLTIVDDDPTPTPFNISARDAKLAEPAAGTATMLFTVALDNASADPISVNYATADDTSGAHPATGGATCGASGVDYQTTSGMLTFNSGERLKTISVVICADTDTESDETLLLNLSNPAGGTLADAQAVGTITQSNPAGTFLISEIRTSGPAGPGDDFVELYNNTDAQLTVQASDSSGGYGLFKIGADCNATPILIGTIANDTVIPARGHFLFVGSQYSLANYGGMNDAAGDATLTEDIESDRNVAVFSTVDVSSLSTVTRLDAVGFGLDITTSPVGSNSSKPFPASRKPAKGTSTLAPPNTPNGVCKLFLEGNPLSPVSGSSTEHSFFRKLCDFAGGACTTPGNPKDTGDNATDFMFADTHATQIAGVQQRLGAPGPENKAAPTRRDATIPLVFLDSTQLRESSPNRVRDFINDPANASSFGTLAVRRRVTNNTGSNVTRLRFRIVEFTTFPSPTGVADLRARNTAMSFTVTGVNDPGTCATTGSPATVPCTVTIQPTTIEQPPTQPSNIGSGMNATLAAGTITLASPLMAGASMNVQFLLGVQQPGAFRILVIIEAQP